MFETRRRRVEFGFAPPEILAKSLDLNTALIFLVLFSSMPAPILYRGKKGH
jgi:hypothetical protein